MLLSASLLLILRHVSYICRFTMIVIVYSILIVNVLAISEIISITIIITPCSVTVWINYKRLSVRVSVNSSCLVCIIVRIISSYRSSICIVSIGRSVIIIIRSVTAAVIAVVRRSIAVGAATVRTICRGSVC